MSRSRGVSLGITGGIGCGKSEVGRILAATGFEVLDTDHVAHELMQPGTDVYSRIIRLFGNQIVGEEGEINRRHLGRLVFSDREKKASLERILHPVIHQRWEQWRRERQSQGINSAVIIPLLFETGKTDGWDSIICVSAEESKVLQRLANRGHTEEDARKRFASQQSLREKEDKSDFTITNNSTLEDLEAETIRVVKEILNKE